MPRDRFSGKRPFVQTSNPVKRPSRQMRSMSRSPSPGRSLPFRSMSPHRRHGDESSKYTGRHLRLREKPSKMLLERKRSMSPRKNHSPIRKSHSPFRKSPMRKSHSSVCSSDVRNAQRMGENYHRDASNAVKREYDRSRVNRRSPSPVHKKRAQSSPHHGPAISSDIRTKKFDTYRCEVRDECDNNSNRGRISSYLDHEPLKIQHEGAESMQYSGHRGNDFPPRNISNRFSAYQNSEAANRYDEHYVNDFRKEFLEKRDAPHSSYSMRDERMLLDSFPDGRDLKPYSAEELKKITVDIRRNIPRESDAIVRHIINPDNVQLVRRTDEGMHPIFERDEIKQGMIERNDDFAEKRVVAIVSGNIRNRSPDLVPFSKHGQGTEYHENFKVRRDKYNSFDDDKFESRPRLSDRWQQELRVNKFASAQNEKLILGRDEYQLRGTDDSQRQSPYRTSHLSGGSRTYESDSRSSEFDMRRPLPTNPNDLRHSLLSRERPMDVMDARQRIMERRERDHETSPRRYFNSRDLDDTNNYRSHFQADSSGFYSWEQEQFQDKWGNMGSGDHLPNFAARPDRYQYKEWLDKPDMVPKGPSYFEHDNRDRENQFSRRGRGFRGFSRGRGFYNRGNTEHFRGRGRGRGTFPMTRRGKKSPNQWEHDLFEMSPEGKMDKICQAPSNIHDK